MSIKFEHINPTILDNLFTKYKNQEYSKCGFEDLSFNHVQDFLLSYLDLLFKKQNLNLLDRISCFVYKNEDDFGSPEINNNKNVNTEELSKRIAITQDSLQEIIDLGCSVSQISNFIDEVVKLSFYGNRYSFKEEVSEITHNLTITIEERQNCNSSFEFEKERLLNDKSLEGFKNQIIDYEKKINVQQSQTNENKKTIKLEVKEMNIEDCFTMKNMLVDILTSKSVFDNEIVNFLSKKVTINGQPFNITDESFLTFLKGRLVLIYHIIWQIVRFVYCYNKKKNQFLPTIM